MSLLVEAAESPEHKRLVQKLIEYIKNEGFEIRCASHEDYAQCGETEGHIPDVRGHRSSDELNAIGEAKTCEDLTSERTKEQFKVFSSRSMSDGKSKGKDVPFYIAITKGCEKELENVLRELSLDKKPNVIRLSF
jgi:hypothetical protein